MKTMTKKERYIATLVGCAVGDTLGMAVEGWKREQIQKYAGAITEPRDPILVRDDDGKLVRKDEFGKIKYYTSALRRGQCTDDTILTLALAESIAACRKIDIEDVARRQLYAVDEDKTRGYGATTWDAMINLRAGRSPHESGVIGGPGNAPAMKMSPVGLYMDAARTYPQDLVAAQRVGRITHLDPRSTASGVVQAGAVYLILQDIQRSEFIDEIVNISRNFEKQPTPEFTLADAGTLTERLVWIKANKDATCNEAYGRLGCGGLAFESHPFSLFMFQKYWDDPVKGIVELVNYGGDCDTTGAIFGALAGARNGMVFPSAWTDIIEYKSRLSDTAEKILEIGARP